MDRDPTSTGSSSPTPPPPFLLVPVTPTQQHLDCPPPSSAAHRSPWEVLLAVCEQADEATLVQLCLVSLGMLELAGRILYRHVHITTAERLHGFFIKVSVL